MTGRRIMMALAPPVVAIIFSVALSSVVLLIAGTSPWEAWREMLAYGSSLGALVETDRKSVV